MKTGRRADGVAQWVRASAAKSDDPSVTPRIHLVEREHRLLEVLP